MKEKALDYLSYDKILNTDLIQQIVRYDAEILYAEEDGVLVRNGGMYYISTESHKTCEKLVPLMGDDPYFTAHNDYEVETISRLTGRKWEIRICYHAVYEGEKMPLPYEHEIRMLDTSYLRFVRDTYKTFGDDKYISERLTNGDLFGAFDESGEIMGFCGHHDDGILGMLEVLPMHRGKGVAKQLMTYLINMDIENGYIPYSQIYITNEVSKALHRKLGFTLSRTPVYWNVQN
ncbi:MAG: GNAT family N-acetyltransferase [Eubacteriaceae bacterium]|nr:GNAT family N-acetyltransferase [Eubacteriaceae bacterium]